jgi:hydroxyethylthiazole kinase
MSKIVKVGRKVPYSKYLKNVKDGSPLIHNMTNQVVANDVANVLISLGAYPIMAYAPQEMDEVASFSKAVVINIGTITSEVAKSMILAGKKANQEDIPVILDPVGVGATSFRKKIVNELFSEISFSAIRGNVAEIATLAGVEWQAKGVDAGEGSGSKEEIALSLAKAKNCVVAISGKEDVLSDGKAVITVKNGHSFMGKITGSGCMLSGVCGAFIGANTKDVLRSTVAAHVLFGIAGEKAARRPDVKGPGTFRSAFIDEVSFVTADDLNKYMKVEVK